MLSFDSPDFQTENRYVMADVIIGSEVRDAVAQLKEGDREIIELFYYHRFTHDEIAKILCISTDSSRKRLQRAKEYLAGIMELEYKKCKKIQEWQSDYEEYYATTEEELVQVEVSGELEKTYSHGTGT